MDNRYRIKIATSDDIGDLLRMHISLYDHHSRTNQFAWGLSPKRMSEQPEYYRKMLANKDIRLLIVYDTETRASVGMGFGWKLSHEYQAPKESGKIEDIWVDPEHRRKGLCRRLVIQLIEFFDSIGVDSLEVQYIQGNHEAEQTWKALGFHDAVKTAHASLAEVEEKCKVSET